MPWALITTGIGPPLLAALIGVGGVFLGLWLTTAGRRTRLVVPFSAGVLLGVVFFGLLPELVEEIGWPVTGLFFAGATACFIGSAGMWLRCARRARTITTTAPATPCCTDSPLP